MNPKMTAADASVFLNQTVQNIHRVLKAKQLDFSKSANRVFFSHSTSQKLLNLKFTITNKVIAVQIVKGGPGKTSITKNIGIRAALYGAKVLLIDLDQQGNLSNDLIKSAESSPVMIDLITDSELSVTDAIIPIFDGLDLIPSRLENSALDNTLTLEHHPLDRVFKDRIDSLRSKYDLILIDCPPAISASVAAAALASDLVICPVAPEKYCLDGLKMTHGELQNLEKKFKRHIPFRIIMNKFDNRTLLSSDILEVLHKSTVYGPKLYKTFVRSSQEFANTTAKKESLFDGLRITPAQEDIDSLTREILDLNTQRPKLSENIVPLGNLSSEFVNQIEVRM
jgi:chromosome partitioning protein